MSDKCRSRTFLDRGFVRSSDRESPQVEPHLDWLFGEKSTGIEVGVVDGSPCRFGHSYNHLRIERSSWWSELRLAIS